MGEALLTRPGGADGGSSGGKTLMTEIITEDKLWTVPKAKDQSFSVRIFGGGAAGGIYTGGGGGWMNNSILNLEAGKVIPITIGAGGMNNQPSKVGQTSSFGTHISALGGQGSCGGSGGGDMFNAVGSSDPPRFVSSGYQFGGGATYISLNQSGDYLTETNNYYVYSCGGKWGGGGGIVYDINNNKASNGYTSCREVLSILINGVISKGGCLYENSQNINQITGFSGLGGNAVVLNNDFLNNYTGYAVCNFINTNMKDIFDICEEGINTIGMGLDFEGEGKTTSERKSIKWSYSSTGSYPIMEFIIPSAGGYGGNGSQPITFPCYQGVNIGKQSGITGYLNNTTDICGGGGYGSSGGKMYGGGGGYGGNGGNGYTFYTPTSPFCIQHDYRSCGGGGGYGPGGDSEHLKNDFFLSNYYRDSNGGYAGGGGASNREYGNSNGGQGGNGICIIQYYV